MSIATYNLTVRCTGGGAAIPGATVEARLTRPDYTADGGNFPISQRVTADENGIAVLALVSNLVGTQDSRYTVVVRTATGQFLDSREIQMPEADSTLAQLVEELPVNTDTQTAAALSAALAEKWATGTEPGGAGTQSSREWAGDAEALLQDLDGTANTLAAGEPVTVDYDASLTRFTFGIPQGEKGDQGPEGPEGPEGPQGPDGLDGTTPVDVSAASIDLSQDGTYYRVTVDGDVTLTFDNPVTTINAFTIEVDHVSGSITFPASVVWPFNTPPSFTSGNAHLFMFVSDDGGTTYRGAALVDYPS